MFLNLVGNIFASWEANFVSATMFPRVGKHRNILVRKHRESQMFPQQCFLVCPGLYFLAWKRPEQAKIFSKILNLLSKGWVKKLNPEMIA
jgi:hypothetical protein